jgi:ABC-type transport system substrate-binding protein/DNA-binding SARP family transcriptional activator/streptogramin lyase
MADTVQLRVFLAGRVAIEADGVALDEGRFAGRQGRLVFAYLVAARGRPVPRDELAEALWGPAPPATWEKGLTVVASKLRSLLTDAGVEGGSALTSAFGCYRLDLPQGSWVDVRVAADAAHAAEQALAAGDLEEARTGAAQAVTLLRQPFLPGEDGPWVDEERRELADVHGRALNVLAEACLHLGDAPSATKWAEQAIALEPFRESGYRRLMEAHAAAGNRAEALQVYERCRRLLAEELGAYPSPETDSIYRQLLAAPGPEEGAPVAAPPAEKIELAPSLQEDEQVKEPLLRRRAVLAAALVGVLAAAIALPLLALSINGSGSAHASARLGGDALGVFDLSSGRIVASVPLGSAPDAAAFGAGSVWVALSDRGVVERIDPTTNTVQQTIVLQGGPSAIAVGGGFVWVAETLAGKVVEIDPRSNGGQKVASIPVGNGPTGIAFGFGAIWVANSVDGTVVRIDPATGATSAPIDVDAGANAIATGDGAVWVTSAAAGVLSKIDPKARSVTGTTNVGNQPVAVATGSDAVWVANGEDGTVSRVDPATGHLKGLMTVGSDPSGLAVEANGSVWVSRGLPGGLTEIDPGTGKVARMSVGASPQGLTLSGTVGYVPAQEPVAAHRGGTLRLVIANPPGQYTAPLPHAFDPSSGYGAWELTSMTNDGLLGYSRAGGAQSFTVVPDLAVGLPTVSDGRRTYTFQLRRGIRYSTGAEVEPSDIRRGIERALLESGGQIQGAYMSVLVGAGSCLIKDGRCDLSRGVVTSSGSNTITFHLTGPDPDFLYQLALPTFDAVPADTPLDAKLPLPATGPYEIASYKSKPATVRLVRNPRFHVWSFAAQPPGYPERIVEQYGFTAASAVRAVEEGKADITADGQDQTWSQAISATLETRYSSQLYVAPLPVVLGLWLNTSLAPFNDVRVRQALNYAVNRNRLVAINGGTIDAELSCQILTPDVDGYKRYCPYTVEPDSTGTYHGPDLARARRLVAASGTKGQAVTVWFYKLPSGVGRANGEYFVSLLRELGYRARLVLVPHTGPTWRPNRQAGVQGWGGDYPSPNDIFSTSFTCRSRVEAPNLNENFAFFCDPSIDTQIARASSLQVTNPSAASALWTTIDREVTDEAPWVTMKVARSTDFVSRLTGNYKFCWLSGGWLTGACLDQLWVR